MTRASLVRLAVVLAGAFAPAIAVAQGGTTPIKPISPDVARTVDAEVRVALFELAAGDELPALSRLERVAALVGKDSSGSGASERAALHFLLAQSYYRLGMLAPFRREAEASLGAGASRYASVLRPQLLVEAYRSGDYPRAASIAREISTGESSGMAALVAGLAAYQSGDLAAARTAFQRASAGQGQFASYAKYMDAVAQLRADTMQAASVVASLEAIGASASGGPFADQAKLTAAQVAYEGRKFDDAVRIASTITEASQLAAPALLTRAWALYKIERTEDAERAFSEFVTRYPNRAERDEAQLMAAQAQLELGRSADAERIFQRVADSTAVEVGVLQAQTNSAIADVARALVQSRAAELLVVNDPVSAKALVLTDSSGTSSALALVVGGVAPAASALQPNISAVSAAGRLDSIAARSAPAVSRVLYARSSTNATSRELGERAQSLASADAAVAVARYRLSEQLEAQQREIALLARLATMLAADSGGISTLAAAHQVFADSLAKLDGLMASAEARLRQMLGQEIQATRSLATENARVADSLRNALTSSADADGKAALDAEVATAASYTRIAEMLSTGLDKAIAHHPAFVLRDSLRAHDARARRMVADLTGSYGGSRSALDAALAALRGGDGPATSAARQALADAEGRRSGMENEVIAAVSAELSARAGEMVAALQRNTEAAQFGSASAAFFRAIDGTRALGGTGTGGGVRSASPERRR
ncbi:MAG TPA: hypothetical protein VM076_14570 [Gemmatimonadaceae bacterium]|nr:hypothetical protein [Gemmatimonadaceae bacterium]